MTHADWSRMLDQLREALNQSAAELARHEQTLASPLMTTDLAEERQVSWQRALERFGDRLQECQAQVDKAGRDAQRAEAGLAEHNTALREFRKRVAETRRQVAKGPESTGEPGA